MKKMKKHALIGFAALLLTACGGPKSEMNYQGGAPEVAVMEITPQPTVLEKLYPANIVGKDYVKVMPRVSGYVQELVVPEGATVRKGQVILRISKDTYIQQVNSTKAAMEVAKADVENATLEVEKTQALFNNKIVSDFDLKGAKLALNMKKAQYEQAKANYDNAVVNLNFTDVVSPTDGVIGTYGCFVGTLVSPNDPKPLTTVSSMKDMYVYFSVSEVDYLNSIYDTHNKVKGSADLILANKQRYPLQGKLDIISGVVDAATGSVVMRASFPNNGTLRGGGSGYVVMPVEIDSAIVIPQAATMALQDKIMVYTVQPDSTLKSRFIIVNPITIDDKFVVNSGLEFGEQIVVENIIKLRDGMKVSAKKQQ